MGPEAQTLNVAPRTAPPRNLRLALLVVLAFVSSLWALFQWGELLTARAGGTPFCSVGETLNCVAVWDSALAQGVHNITQVPIAGWGLVWGLCAFVFSLWALVDEGALKRGVASALRLFAVVGVVSSLGLFAASMLVGALCLGCIGTYVVVAAWAVLAFLATKPEGFVAVPRGALLSFGLVVASYLILLVPGMRTPHALEGAGKDAMAKSAQAGQPAAPAAPATAATDSASPFMGPATGDATRDGQLAQFIASLDDDTKRMLSSMLMEYEKSPQKTLPASRVVIGKADAAVKFVDFTDPLCGHCAAFHETLKEMKQYVPADLFSVEPRFFPLDHACNPEVARTWDNDIRCQAVRAQLCVSEPAQLEGLQAAIFAAQSDLTPEKLKAIAAPFLGKKSLESCSKDASVQKALVEDIQAGMALGLEGTPLVLLNGKEVKPFGPLVFVLALTGGKTKHPALATLPAPQPLPAHEHAHH